ncbi:MAG: ABC transporter permease [Burkholderiales bacterium]|nr:ABC transporter permease [Burkholderiales bacterium]
MLLRLAVRNVLRHKARTGMTLAAIVMGVTALILSGGFVQDIFAQLAEAIVHSQYGHVQLAKAGYFREGSRKPDQFVVAKPEALKSRILAQNGVSDVMARLAFAGLLNNGRTDLAIVGEGIEPDREARLGSYVAISAGRQLGDADAFGALVGQGVADSLKLAPGDRVTLLASTPEGAMNTVDLEVVGIFQSFSKEYDARAVKIPLAAAQELLGTPGANVLVVSLMATRDTARVAHALAASLADERIEAKPWYELSDFYDKTVELYDRQFGVLRLIVLAMVLLSVANSVNMSVFERVGEFGTMRALGDRGRKTFALVVTENAVLGLTGAAIGVALGALLAAIVSAIGIPMPPPPNSDLAYVGRIRIVPQVVASAFFTGVAATLLAALLPAWRMARMEVAAALRAN